MSWDKLKKPILGREHERAMHESKERSISNVQASTDLAFDTSDPVTTQKNFRSQ